MEDRDKILTLPKDEKFSFFKNDENQGRWKLELLIPEDQIEKFSLVTLAPYEHPVLQQKYFPSQNGNPLSHFVVDKILTYFQPETKKDHRKILDWLILHPEVQVDGLTLSEQELNNKVKAKFILVNIDQQDFTQMEEDNVIDEMVGRLSFSTGTYAISMKRLRYASAALGLSYKDKRHSNNADTEKIHLRNKLKHYVKKGTKEAKEFKAIISNIDNAEKMFALKVLLDKKEVIYEHGVYKYNGNLMGSSLESCIGYLDMNADINAEMVDKAKGYIREEGHSI